MSDDQECVPKEFNDANIRVAREYKARAEAAEAVLERLTKSWDVVRSGWNYVELDFALKDARRILAAVSTPGEPK